MDSQIFSQGLLLTSGTVPIDIYRGLILLLRRSSPWGSTYHLPTTSKKVGESLKDAALRGTTEQTGLRCLLLQYQLPTNAPGHSGSHHSEPIAVQQHRNLLQGVNEYIFWYLSQVDSRSQRISDNPVHMQFQHEWVPIEGAPSRCTAPEDRALVMKALEAFPHLASQEVPYLSGHR